MKKGKKSEVADSLPERIEFLDIATLRPNTWNKSRAVTDEFVESIKVNGILQPPVVRPSGALFEIVAGERRWKAAKAAGLKQIACKIIEADDDRARELTLVENIDRENLTPLEEAAEIAELVKLHHGDAVEVAARLGRSRHFVKSRLALSKLDLSIFKDTDIEPELMPAACLELLAKAPPEMQKKIVADAYGGLNDYEDLRNAMVELSRKLGGLFDADDETLLPEAGACSSCPKRTGSDPDLFGNVAGLMKSDHCLDEDCYSAKVRAGLARKEADARKKHPDLILAAKKIPYGDREEAEKRKVEQIDAPYRSKLVAAKKGEMGAAPAFLWCGPGAGTVTWVKPAKGESLSANARPKTLKEKRAALAMRRQAWVAEKARQIVLSKPLHEDFHTWEKLLKIALRFGCSGKEFEDKHDMNAATLKEAAEIVRKQTKGYRASDIDMNADRTQVADALYLIYGKDAIAQVSALERDAVNEIKEPKSWTKGGEQ